jgi:RNA polymerase sigma factor (sigma-70 family)
VHENQWLAERFEAHRPRLRAVAYRMLGSVTEADDAVQDAWLRLNRSEANQIDNLAGWLTTVVARECLHMLRSRLRRREDLVDPVAERLPDPIISSADAVDPGEQVLLADSVGIALMVVLDSLTPTERLAFVLHDLFDLPFDEIAGMVNRSPAAARQLASRARRRVQGAKLPDGDVTRQRAVVDAFYAAVNSGDLDALVKVLDPDVVVRADYGPSRPPAVYRGAATIAKLSRQARGAELHPVLVNGLPGVVATRFGRPYSIYAFTIIDDRILEIDGIRDPERVRRLVAGVLQLDP